ncbi:MAG TPA: hypothetical protein VFT22_00060 [Kofleriaceae bacterium]|nr:hypothetical protein [Kofleriaceae bacterium]
MSRDDQIRAILEVGRQTRKPTPRWMWIAAMLVGVLCATGFLVAMLGERAPSSRPVAGGPARVPEGARSKPRPGLGVGLLLGAGAGVVIGVAVARQRRSHSSRNSP